MAISQAITGKTARLAAAVLLGLSCAVIPASGAAPTAKPDAHIALQDDAANADRLAERFDDAPYGVDPIVTGPVSTAFKQRQEAARCAEAAWPNVPQACFPD
jgi:hypothetical protein